MPSKNLLNLSGKQHKLVKICYKKNKTIILDNIGRKRGEQCMSKPHKQKALRLLQGY